MQVGVVKVQTVPRSNHVEANFCHNCGHRIQHNVTEDAAGVDELIKVIKGYFHRGYLTKRLWVCWKNKIVFECMSEH